MRCIFAAVADEQAVAFGRHRHSLTGEEAEIADAEREQARLRLLARAERREARRSCRGGAGSETTAFEAAAE